MNLVLGGEFVNSGVVFIFQTAEHYTGTHIFITDITVTDDFFEESLLSSPLGRRSKEAAGDDTFKQIQQHRAPLAVIIFTADDPPVGNNIITVKRAFQRNYTVVSVDSIELVIQKIDKGFGAGFAADVLIAAVDGIADIDSEEAGGFTINIAAAAGMTVSTRSVVEEG